MPNLRTAWLHFAPQPLGLLEYKSAILSLILSSKLRMEFPF